MTIREHAILFGGLVTRWPRFTAIVIGGLAVFYFVYYAAVEDLSVFNSLLAGIGMALMCIVLKTTYLFVFYCFFQRDEFSGSFLILSFMAALPLVAAMAVAMLLAQRSFEGPPPGVIPYLLGGAGLFFGLAFGGAARVFYWIGGGGLKRR